MDFLRHKAEIDAVVPGVSDAYAKLRDSHGQGLYTSLGRYYNHTIFGRDAGMTAKFVSLFDHQTAWEAILTLASYQGQNTDPKTAEQPGKMHHEMRDYSQWRGDWHDKILFNIAGLLWGKTNQKLVSYYAADTTATYIRLVNKYANSIDRSILERQVPQLNGATIRLSQSVANAADWICRQVDENGMFWVQRTNRWSLPYQTFADSVTAYAWADGSAADASRQHSFVEVQVYAMDALEDASKLLPSHPDSHQWHETAKKMQAALLEHFWSQDKQTFSPGIFVKDGSPQRLESDMITAAWTLNASFWESLPSETRQRLLEAIIARIFQADFMTEYGVRTKSVRTPEPLGDTIDYHGSQTVWPMFNFMIIEGLRRHGLYRLARQIERRILNATNALGGFPEFFIVDHDGALYRPSRSAKAHKSAQMIPEQNIAFTVAPALTLAYRHLYKRHTPIESGWQYEFETSLLKEVKNIELLAPNEARRTIEMTPLRLRRFGATVRSVVHIAPVILKNVS